MSKVKYTKEFMLRSSPSILFNFLTSSSSLAQWFCDSCDRNGDTYTFSWDGYEEEAVLEDTDDETFVRYSWIDGEDGEFFEFKIMKSEISNDTILVITDFAETEDVEDQKQLWESQIEALSGRIGA